MLALTNLETALQAQIDALTGSADVKHLAYLSKAIEAAVGNITVGKMLTKGAEQLVQIGLAGGENVGLVNTAGATQVGAVIAAGVAKLAELAAVTALQKTGGTMTGPLIGDVGVIADASTITLDFGVKQNFEITTSGARTMANPLNANAKGLEGTIEIVGAPVFSWGGSWKFQEGALPTFSGRSIIAYRVVSSAFIEASVSRNFT